MSIANFFVEATDRDTIQHLEDFEETKIRDSFVKILNSLERVVTSIEKGLIDSGVGVNSMELFSFRRLIKKFNKFNKCYFFI